MFTVCAWCDRLMAKPPAAEVTLVTHGICAACAARQDWRDSPTLVVSRQHAHLAPVLSQLLRGEPHVNVLVDRRSAERRQLERPDIGLERRARADRRQSGTPLVLA
jgi:hypothetical protein